MNGYLIEYTVVEKIGNLTRNIIKRGIFQKYDLFTMVHLKHLGAIEHTFIGKVNATKFCEDIDCKKLPDKLNQKNTVPKLTKPVWYTNITHSLENCRITDSSMRDEVLNKLDNLLVSYYASYNNSIAKSKSNGAIIDELRKMVKRKPFKGRIHLLRCIDDIPNDFK